MAGDTITIQAGQCGNQVGLQYWDLIAKDHGIDANGARQDSILSVYPSFESSVVKSNVKSHEDGACRFFNVSDRNTYTPRAVLLDLEPSVLSKCTQALPMINPRNIHVSQRGGGAANNWNKGYLYGTEHQEEILNLLDREADRCDLVENFQLFHSIAGGTGAGVGSLILELLSDRYGSKKTLNTFSVLPSNENSSDVVVQPYNSILTLKRLCDYSDATVIFHNDALNSIDNELFRSQYRSGYSRLLAYDGPNKLIAYVLASVSNPVRFPNYMYGNHAEIFASLVPSSSLKFFTASLAPYTDLFTQSHSYANEYDLLLELGGDAYRMNRVSPNTKYISALNFVFGNSLNHHEIRKGTLKMKKRLPYVPWVPHTLGTVYGRRLPYTLANPNDKGLGGIQILNNTSIALVFGRIVKQFDQLARRDAYISSYSDLNSAADEARVKEAFSECREGVVLVIEEYKRSAQTTYLEEDDGSDVLDMRE